MNHNFQIHLVCGSDLKEGLIDAHTHGLDSFGSLELQFVLPFPEEHIGAILNEVGELVSEGFELCDGMELDQLDCLIPPAKILVKKTKDAFGEDIFRLILPDGEYKYPEESKEWPYYLQYEDPYDAKQIPLDRN